MISICSQVLQNKVIRWCLLGVSLYLSYTTEKSETLTSDVQHTITDISFIKSTNLVLGDIFITKYLDETFISSAQNKK